MIKLEEKKNCTGCGACAQACPVGCISMQADAEGFLYPSVDSAACIDCDLCTRVCPTQKEYTKNPTGEAFLCINQNAEIREKSSSGGVFTLLAETVIRKGGVVFGAAFDQDFMVHHIAVDNIADLEKLRGSKYVQSRIENTYQEAKELLESGTTVLFTGTPCQIGGLMAYLDKDYENLITQDLICHGVPSAKVWERYIHHRETVAAAKTQRTFFRYKKYGWKTYSVQFEFTNCTEYVQTLYQDLYMQAFLKNACLRPSCAACHFKSMQRQSDITLADFWGVDKVFPELDDNQGTSLVLVNSLKGMDIFRNIQPDLLCRETLPAYAEQYNQAAIKSAIPHKNREKFMQALDTEPFDVLVRKYCTDRKVVLFLRKVKGRIKRILRRIK